MRQLVQTLHQELEVLFSVERCSVALFSSLYSYLSIFLFTNCQVASSKSSSRRGGTRSGDGHSKTTSSPSSSFSPRDSSQVSNQRIETQLWQSGSRPTTAAPSHPTSTALSASSVTYQPLIFKTGQTLAKTQEREKKHATDPPKFVVSLVLHKCDRLPKVKAIGKIDSFIKVRISRNFI